MSGFEILFVRNPFRLFEPLSWVNAIIRLFIGFKYNHTAIRFKWSGIVYVVESRNSGVVLATEKNWLRFRSEKIFFALPISGVNVERIFETLGTPYDNKSLFQQAYFILTNKWIGSQDVLKVNCAEIVAYYLGLYEPHKWTPKTLYKLLKTE